MAERLERLGFRVTRVPQERFGDHLVGENPGGGPKRLLFVGHFDTVFASGTAKERPFRIGTFYLSSPRFTVRPIVAEAFGLTDRTE